MSIHEMTHALGYQNTDIGLIPKDWNFGKILDFSKTDDEPIQTGPFGAQLHSSDYVKEGIPLILIKNIQDGKIIEDNIPRISLKKADELDRYRLKLGDIVFSRVGSVGRSAVIKEDQVGWLLSGQMLRVRLENLEISTDFLSYMIQTSWFQKALESKIVGATRKSINTEILSNLPIIKPDISEQQSISTILSTVDNAIQRSRKAAAETERLKAGVMHELMTNGIGHTEFREDPDFETVPKEWVVKPLDELIEIVDCRHHTPTYIESGYPVVRPQNIKMDGIDFSNCTYISRQEYLLMTERHTPKKGDIVYSRNASFGIPAFVETDREFCIGQDMVVMTKLTADTKYIFYVLCSGNIQQQLKQLSGGSTIQRINLKDIRRLLTPEPELKEQQKISAILTTVDNKLALQHQRTTHYEHLKQGLMNELLTGKRRVKVG